MGCFFFPQNQLCAWGEGIFLAVGAATSLQALEVLAPQPKASVCLRVNIYIYNIYINMMYIITCIKKESVYIGATQRCRNSGWERSAGAGCAEMGVLLK